MSADSAPLRARRIRAVLFDMDGTLIDSEATHMRALQDVLAEQGLAEPPGFDAACTGLAVDAVHARLVGEFGLRMDLASFNRRKNEAFLRRLSELSCRPGAEAALALLRTAEVAHAIVSNSGRALMDACLNSLGLVHPGLVTVSRDDVARGKPAPDPYLRAALQLGLAPAECLVVEDSGPGAAAGLAAGMPTVGWPEPHRDDIDFPPGIRLLAADEDGTALVALLRSLNEP